MKPICIFMIFFFLTTYVMVGQTDSILSKLTFEMDYRFRVEQDWNSKKPDGTLRQDRSRLRYRIRAGATYANQWYAFGLRLRTGDPRKQQDPQITLGKGSQEFSTIPIGFEKLFFQYHKNRLKIWLGKNTYPFKKNNELFWSDNVYPEGLTIEKTFASNSQFIDKINLVGGHYIISSQNKTFSDDAYMQGIQANFFLGNNLLEFSSSAFLLNNIPNIPDGAHTDLLDYAILHFGSALNLNKFKLTFDYYQNTKNYDKNTNIEQALKNQKTGYVISAQYGNLKAAKNWLLKLTYAHVQRYAILDYMAQNDWARWDYSSSNSADGRLSNFEGIESVVGYSVSKKINLVLKYYFVEQLIPYGVAKENGQRVRLDFNVKI